MRIKIIGAIVIVFSVLFLSIFVVSQSIIEASYSSLEKDLAEQNLMRVVNVLDDTALNLQRAVSDYAFWDETIDYVSGSNPAYADNNIFLDVPISLDINMMLIYDREGNPVKELVVDIDEFRELPLPADIDQLLETNSPLLSHSSSASRLTGLIHTESGLLMVSSVPILNNQAEGPVFGTMIFGRYYEEDRIAELSDSLQLDLDFIPLTDPAALQYATLVLPHLTTENPITVQVIDEKTIHGFTMLTDLNGAPLLLVRSTQARDIYQHGQQALNLLAYQLLLTGVVLSLAMAILLEFLVIRRVTGLSRAVEDIQINDGFQRVLVQSNDEVTSLGRSINHLLGRLDENHQQLNEQNAALQIAFQEARDAVRLKNDFLSMMSHELRTPLNAIIGYTGILVEDIDEQLDEDAREMVTHINSSSQRLLALINDVLNISKIETGSMTLCRAPFDIATLIDQIHSQSQVLAAQKGIFLRVIYHDTLPERVIGDQNRLRQVIVNLISNGIKFTSDGGVTTYVGWQDNNLKLRICDTGIGIPKDSLKLIFEEFRQVDSSSTRNYQGTGLGLTIAKKVIEAMNGSISVTSTVGGGTEFAIKVPLDDVPLDSKVVIEGEKSSVN